MRKKKRKKLSILDQLSLEARKYKHLPVIMFKDNPILVEPEEQTCVVSNHVPEQVDQIMQVEPSVITFEELSGNIEKAPQRS